MAFVLHTETANMPKLTYTADASVSFTKGLVAYRDTSSKEIKVATDSVGTTLNIECVLAKTETTAASNPTVEAHPIISGASQLWIADCANNTAADQLNIAHGLTAAGLVSNTNTHTATTLGIFVALAVVGAASDKKLLGYFVKVGQVTA